MIRTAQLVTDLILRVNERGPKGLGIGTGAQALRRMMIRHGDPLVRCQVAGFELELPLSHELPYHRVAAPDYGTNLGRLAAAVASKYPEASVIDIGANVGDTAAIVRGGFPEAPILCIEGDERFFQLLRRNAALIPRLHLEKTLVGRSRETIDGRLSTGGGTGHIETGAGAGLRLEPLDAILARWPMLPRPRLVKIDTDGFDCAIIEGAVAVWERLQPVIFFEYDPAYLPASFEPAAFFGRLLDAGYARALVYDNRGDFMLATELGDRSSLEDIHYYFSGRNHDRYADIALFAGGDVDLARAFRDAELAYFDRARGNRGR